jgi:hypothetical protein
MITPSTIAKKASAQPLPPSEYNFPEQVREGEGKTPLLAGYYTYASMQTYSYSGYPNDSRGDNWD